MAYDENGEWVNEEPNNPDEISPKNNLGGSPTFEEGAAAKGGTPDTPTFNSKPSPLNEDYFKNATLGAGAYDPNVYNEYLKDPSQQWADRLVNKENLRANNDVGDEYHANGKGGYLTGPAKPTSKLLGGSPSSSGGSGGYGTPWENDIYGTLKGLFPGGGFNQDIVNRRVDSARTGLEAQRKNSIANNEAYLADRGLVGSGPQASASGNLESRLFGQFGSAYNDIYANESENADKRMMSALQAATGMSEADAQRQIDWFRAQTENELGHRAADTADRNAGTGETNAATGSYTAQHNYEIATQQIKQAQRELDEAIRTHNQEAADRAQGRINELEQIRAAGTHKK